MTTNHNIHKKTFKVKGLLVTAGIHQTEIVKSVKKSKQAVSRVILNQSTSSLIRTEIATRLGTTVSKLWPKKRRRIARA